MVWEVGFSIILLVSGQHMHAYTFKALNGLVFNSCYVYPCNDLVSFLQSRFLMDCPGEPSRQGQMKKSHPYLPTHGATASGEANSLGSDGKLKGDSPRSLGGAGVIRT